MRPRGRRRQIIGPRPVFWFHKRPVLGLTEAQMHDFRQHVERCARRTLPKPVRLVDKRET